MKMLYESAIADMIRLLDKTVDDFSMANDISGVTPLFCISNKQFLLMKTVDYFSNYQVLNGCRQLCIDMCEQMKLPIKIIAGDEDVDFILEVDDKSIGVLLSFKPNFMPNVSDELMYAIEKLQVYKVDVNEQNIQAVGFYQHMGFSVITRSDLDVEGKEYPILHMRR